MVKLTKKEFRQKRAQKQLVMSFIGMSNIGKTYLSRKLKQVGFRHIHCDGLIEEKLKPVIADQGFSGIEAVSKWMGQPYTKQYHSRQHYYLAREKEVMEEIVEKLHNNTYGNTVIDTTGSMVHLGDGIARRLSTHSLVVYVKASDGHLERMFQTYLEKPKPVVFSNTFTQKSSETPQHALRRSYKKLLTVRSALYDQYADVVIPREAISPHMPIRKFIELIEQLL